MTGGLVGLPGGLRGRGLERQVIRGKDTGLSMVFETVMLFQKEEGEDSFVWPERIGAQRRRLSRLRGKARGLLGGGRKDSEK